MFKNKDKIGGRPKSGDAQYKGKMMSFRLNPMDEMRLGKLVSKSGLNASKILRGLITDG